MAFVSDSFYRLGRLPSHHRYYVAFYCKIVSVLPINHIYIPALHWQIILPPSGWNSAVDTLYEPTYAPVFSLFLS